MSVLKKYKMLIFLIITCVLLEMFIANISDIGLVISGGECIKMPLDSQSIGSYKGNISFYDGKISVSGGDITFNDINSEMHNVSLTVNGSGIYVPITVSFTDDNFAYEQGFDYNSNDISLYAYKDTENYIMLSSYGNVKSLRISFDKLDTPIEITDISINKIPNFRFNFLRFGIIILIALVIKYKLWNVKVSDRHPPLLFMVTVVLCGCIMCSAVVIANSASDVSLLQDYPISNINAQDQYTQLFDAFQKGQLNLDLDYDTSNFDRAENIYDRSERKHEGISGSFWDRAYYNGKFYSYFGAAPVITVFYPIYLLTGRIPSNVFASALLAIYATVFIALLYNIIVRRFCKDVSVPLYLFGFVSLIFSSGILAAAAENMFYYMAVLSGIGGVAAFLYFLLQAYYSEKLNYRILYLILTGLSVVHIAASRPTLLVYVFVAVVPALLIFSDENDSFKNKLMYITSIGVPILIGAVLLMLYNCKRFDNPLEFGFNYQLTVSIAKANTITLAMLPATIYHYYIQPSSLSGQFPYVKMNISSLDTYARYNYVGRTLGILNYPIMWGAILFPFAEGKRKELKKPFLLSLTAAAVLLSFIDMCKAGVNYRYTIDILFILGLAALVFTFDLLSLIDKASHKKYMFVYIFVVGCLAVSIAIGYLLVISNESRFIMKNAPGFARFMEMLVK